MGLSASMVRGRGRRAKRKELPSMLDSRESSKRGEVGKGEGEGEDDEDK
jgi:hypothetical protein